MKSKYLFSSLFSLFAITFLFSQNCEFSRYTHRVFEEINITSDIEYGMVDPYEPIEINTLEPIYLDFYEPVGDVLEKRPLVVMCFGGAFQFGQKEDNDMASWCDSLAHRGYACASISYRLGFNVLVERSAYRAVYRALQDLRAAIRFLQEDPNNQGFQVDPDYIFVGGQSAGAITSIHTAFLNTETDRPPETYASDFSVDDGSDLGCLDCSGNSYDQPVSIKGILAMWGAIESLAYIDAEEQTPILTVHGSLDPIVPYNTGSPFNSPTFPTVHGSNIMKPQFDLLGIYNEFYPYPGDASHTVYGAPNVTFPNGEWNPIFAASHTFLTTVMQYNSPTPNGSGDVEKGSTSSYSVTANPASSYCWTVENGIIIEDNGNAITVQWSSTENSGSVTVEESNYFALMGMPTSMEVNLQGDPPLATQVIQLAAHQEGEQIVLAWSTSVFSSSFSIEKSKNGLDFKTLQTLEENTFVDASPFLGSNFYRITTILENGEQVYSETVEVAFKPIGFKVKYILRTGNQLSMTVASPKEGDIHIKLYDITGRLWATQKVVVDEGENELILENSSFNSQLYLLRVEGFGVEEIKKGVW